MTGVGRAFYNEIEPFAADWIERLAKEGVIAGGVVERRSIRDLRAFDVGAFRACHFFAGLGGWSHALRLAGWPEDRRVWTGSCPCQPFSVAGRGKGTDDGRHLWPEWFRLIRECRPPVVFGEQVASPAGLEWFDAVSADLEGEGYAVGAADLCAAGVGAPHMRQRLYFVAYATGGGRREGGMPGQAVREHGRGSSDGERMGDASEPRGRRGAGAILGTEGEGEGERRELGRVADEPVASSEPRVMADAVRGRLGASGELHAGRGESDASRGGEPRVMADADGERRDGLDAHLLAGEARRAMPQASGSGEPRLMGDAERGRRDGLHERDEARHVAANPRRSGARFLPDAARGETAGWWGGAEWLVCRDGKARPIEPGSFPLADGVPGRVGRVRAYGNAIVPQVAADFVMAARASMEALGVWEELWV